MRTFTTLPLFLAALAAACGGGSSPSGPEPTPTPVPGTPVSGSVFYDENGNGRLDAEEICRIPGVTVTIGGRTGQTALGGRFTVQNVPAGQQSAVASADLPAYFTAGTAASVTAPATADVAVPIVLNLTWGARANVYLAFGDSITAGDGSSGGGYVDGLGAMMRSYWGKAQIINDGQAGTKSAVGRGRIGASLSRHHPAHVLILYGTNDWNEPECRNAFPCYTVDSLRTMAQEAKGWGGYPVIGTIPPVNPAYVDRNAEERNDWVKRMNEQIRAMARQERVPIAEVHGDMLKQTDLRSLFADDKHPNDAGYAIITRSFFDAITRPYTASASGRRRSLFFDPPGF